MDGTSTLTGKKLAALVVDDDPMIRKIHKVILSKVGFEAYEVENGKKAVDLFHLGASFDWVLMDMEMPVMDGPTATKALRATGRKAVIVGITSRNLDPEIQEFMNSGLDYCLVKPLTVEKMKAIVQEINKN